jgi:chemotaxis protein methyltransferase CheR
MMFADEKERWKDWQIEITGTDISETVLEKARSGRYTQFEIQRGLSVDHMLRYFRQEGEEWHLIPEVQQMVRYRQDNLLRPSAAMGPYDLILCRNVLMYFGPETRHIAYSRLTKSIAHDGLLMLGAAETVIGHTEQFKTNPELRGLYTLVPSTTITSA